MERVRRAARGAHRRELLHREAAEGAPQHRGQRNILARIVEGRDEGQQVANLDLLEGIAARRSHDRNARLRQDARVRLRAALDRAQENRAIAPGKRPALGAHRYPRAAQSDQLPRNDPRLALGALQVAVAILPAPGLRFAPVGQPGGAVRQNVQRRERRPEGGVRLGLRRRGPQPL